MEKDKDLVLIIADEDGKIKWDGISISPITFIRNFLKLSGGYSIPLGDNRTCYKLDEYNSKKILKQSQDETMDALKVIEARKHGLEFVDPVMSISYKFKFYRHTNSNNKGYLFLLEKQLLEMLSKTGIEYLIDKQSEIK